MEVTQESIHTSHISVLHEPTGFAGNTPSFTTCVFTLTLPAHFLLTICNLRRDGCRLCARIQPNLPQHAVRAGHNNHVRRAHP